MLTREGRGWDKELPSGNVHRRNSNRRRSSATLRSGSLYRRKGKLSGFSLFITVGCALIVLFLFCFFIPFRLLWSVSESDDVRQVHLPPRSSDLNKAKLNEASLNEANPCEMILRLRADEVDPRGLAALQRGYELCKLQHEQQRLGAKVVSPADPSLSSGDADIAKSFSLNISKMVFNETIAVQSVVKELMNLTAPSTSRVQDSQPVELDPELQMRRDLYNKYGTWYGCDDDPTIRAMKGRLDHFRQPDFLQPKTKETNDPESTESSPPARSSRPADSKNSGPIDSESRLADAKNSRPIKSINSRPNTRHLNALESPPEPVHLPAESRIVAAAQPADYHLAEPLEDLGSHLRPRVIPLRVTADGYSAGVEPIKEPVRAPMSEQADNGMDQEINLNIDSEMHLEIHQKKPQKKPQDTQEVNPRVMNPFQQDDVIEPQVVKPQGDKDSQIMPQGIGHERIDDGGIDNEGIDNEGIDNGGIDNGGIDNGGIDNEEIDNEGIELHGDRIDFSPTVSPGVPFLEAHGISSIAAPPYRIGLLFMINKELRHPKLWTEWIQTAYEWSKKLYLKREGPYAIVGKNERFVPLFSLHVHFMGGSGGIYTSLRNVWKRWGLIAVEDSLREAADDPRLRLPAIFQDAIIPATHCGWGDLNPCEFQLLKYGLRDSNTNGFIFVSESTIPVKPLEFIYEEFQSNPRSRFFFSNINLPLVRKHHQWIVLSRDHAAKLVNRPEKWTCSNWMVHHYPHWHVIGNYAAPDEYLPFYAISDLVGIDNVTLEVNDGRYVDLRKFNNTGQTHGDRNFRQTWLCWWEVPEYIDSEPCGSVGDYSTRISSPVTYHRVFASEFIKEVVQNRNAWFARKFSKDCVVQLPVSTTSRPPDSGSHSLVDSTDEESSKIDSSKQTQTVLAADSIGLEDWMMQILDPSYFSTLSFHAYE